MSEKPKLFHIQFRNGGYFTEAYVIANDIMRACEQVADRWPASLITSVKMIAGEHVLVVDI